MKPDTTGSVIESGPVAPHVDLYDARRRRELRDHPAAVPEPVSAGGYLTFATATLGMHFEEDQTRRQS
jgi:hypothetical protein